MNNFWLVTDNLGGWTDEGVVIHLQSARSKTRSAKTILECSFKTQNIFILSEFHVASTQWLLSSVCPVTVYIKHYRVIYGDHSHVVTVFTWANHEFQDSKFPPVQEQKPSSQRQTVSTGEWMNL